MHGSPIRPIRIGNKAVIVNNGKVHQTSRVIALHEYTCERICFETLDALYRLSIPPLTFANTAAKVQVLLAA